MPNHVTTRIRIQLHDGVDHKEFLEKIGDCLNGGPCIDFEKIAPQPDNVLASLEWDHTQGGKQPLDWYDWRCINWGTKWNAYDQELVDISYGCIELKFDTAWAPPMPIIEKLREMEEVEWVGGNYVEEFCESAGVF